MSLQAQQTSHEPFRFLVPVLHETARGSLISAKRHIQAGRTLAAGRDNHNAMLAALGEWPGAITATISVAVPDAA